MSNTGQDCDQMMLVLITKGELAQVRGALYRLPANKENFEALQIMQKDFEPMSLT